jgi:EF hand domain-containing protein
MYAHLFGQVVLLLCMATLVAGAQESRGRGSRPPGTDQWVRWANEWDSNQDQVYTCEEWKRYVTNLFNKADRNRDGYVDANEFKLIQEAAAQFRNAEFGYFDDNGDGRVSRSEFIDKPNPFFLQYDRNRDCKVTLEEIMSSSAPPASSRPESGRPPMMSR